MTIAMTILNKGPNFGPAFAEKNHLQVVTKVKVVN